MNKNRLIVPALIVLVLLGGSYAWHAATIIADETPPVIDEVTTTHGDVSYGTGQLTVSAYVNEAIGMDRVVVTLRRGLPPTGTLLQRLTLGLVQKLDSETYHYRGTFTATLNKEQTYNLFYTATDEAGHRDEFMATVRLLNIDGYVTVNGIRIEDTDDTIVLKTLDLEFKVFITAGADTVQSILCMVGGAQVADFEKKGNLITGFYWYATYRLPSDGTYPFTLQVLDTAGNDIQLASFTIDIGKNYSTIMIIAAVGILGIIGLSGYLSKDKKTPVKKRKTKTSKTRKKKRSKK